MPPVTFQGGVTIVIDPQKLAEVMRSPSGPVMRELLVAAEEVKQVAQGKVGVYQLPPGGPARARRPGTLRDSIVKRVGAGSALTAQVEVGSSDPVALWHHEGTVPHVIQARRAPRLVFWWGKVGKVVAFPKVNHPGTRPNRFLTDALAEVWGRRYG